MGAVTLRRSEEPPVGSQLSHVFLYSDTLTRAGCGGTGTGVLW